MKDSPIFEEERLPRRIAAASCCPVKSDHLSMGPRAKKICDIWNASYFGATFVPWWDLHRAVAESCACVCIWRVRVCVCVCVWLYLWNIKEGRVCDSSVFFHIWYNLPGVTRCLVAAVHLGRMPISTLSDQMEVCPGLKSDRVHTLFRA